MSAEACFRDVAPFIDITRTEGGFDVIGDTDVSIGRDWARMPDQVGPTVEVGWSWRKQLLTVRGDRLGCLPLFVAQAGPRIIVSTDLRTMVRRRGEARLDKTAVAVFLRLGYFLGLDTPFEGISQIPPAAVLQWQGYPVPLVEPKPSGAVSSISWSAAVDAYIELFAQAVARRLRSDYVLTHALSGGRDSRHILLRLLALGARPVELLTLARPGPTEAEIATARRIATMVNIPHRIIPFDYSRAIRSDQEKNRRTHCLDGEYAWYHAITAAMGRDVTAMFDGLAGDVLSNGLFFDADLLRILRAGQWDAAARRLLGSPARPYLTMPGNVAADYEAVCERIAKELARYGNTANPVKSFYFNNRTRREISLLPYVIAAERVAVATPYLDADVMDFLMSLPGENFGPPGFHDAAIARAFPDAAEIPYAGKTATPLSTAARMRLMLAFARFLASARNPAGTNWRFVLPRICRGMMGNPYGEWWWISRLIWLDSLDELVREGTG